jgi:Uma2 family endonuclease
MTGGTLPYALIQCSLAISVGGRLLGHPCRFVNNGLKIEINGKIRYPDGFVFCSAPPAQSSVTVVRDPVVIFEVLSDSTARTDLVTKNRDYGATPSVQRYVILSQDVDTMFERIGSDWLGHLLDADAVLRMPEIGIEVPLAEFYEGVDFSRTDTNQ